MPMNDRTDIYDLNAVIASVGGALGLFLGFSFYKCGKWFIDLIPIGRFQSKKSLTKTSPASDNSNLVSPISTNS